MGWKATNLAEMNYLFSGHETFPLRYTWISKTVRALAETDSILIDLDKAIVDLGLGKNMVRALRFWLEAGGIVEFKDKTKTAHQLTSLGAWLFGKRGQDPYLEDLRSLWVLHWMFSTNVAKPLFAWHFLLGQWHEAEFTQSMAVDAFLRTAASLQARATKVTLAQHFSVFVHTYLPQKGNKGEIIEESLDCPLAELNLLTISGFREGPNGRREAAYSFNREHKPEITPGLFSFALHDYWQNYHPNEQTIDFRDICYGVSSPGQVFKLPEQDVRALLESSSSYGIKYQESAAFQRAIKEGKGDKMEALSRAFQEEFAYA
jgi:hypothetical protein